MTIQDLTIQNSPELNVFRFAVAATFTAEPLRPAIAFWGRQLHAGFEPRFAPYNQVLQTLIDPASEFGANTHGVNIVLVRIEDLGPLDGSAGQFEANVAQLAGELRTASSHLAAPLLLSLCPPSPAFPQDLEQRLSQSLIDSLGQTPGVHILSRHEIDDFYPV